MKATLLILLFQDMRLLKHIQV